MFYSTLKTEYRKTECSRSFRARCNVAKDKQTFSQQIILKDLVIGSTLLSASIETKHSKLSIEKQSVADHAEHVVMLQKLSKLLLNKSE